MQSIKRFFATMLLVLLFTSPAFSHGTGQKHGSPAFEDLILGFEDFFGRSSLWYYAPDSILTLGSNQVDGLPYNVKSEGAIFYGANTDGDFSSGLSGFARIKPDRFGLLNKNAGFNGYLWRVDLSSNDFYATTELGIKTFQVDRRTGDINMGGSYVLSNYTEGGTGAIVTKTAREDHTLTLGATSDTVSISIPSGAIIMGAQFTVNTAVADSGGDDTWSAAFITGDTSALATGAAAAVNTKVNTMLVPVKTTGVAEIQFTPNGGSFTSGVIECQVYYRDLTSLAN